MKQTGTTLLRHLSGMVCSRIGLFNVNSRIKLLYGDNSGLCLSSRIEGGLRVAIRIYLAEHFDCISMDIRANQELDSVEA